MDRIKRNERLAAMARVLTGTPNRLYTLSHFTEMFGAAKSTVSEDLSILADTFAQFDLGRLSTVAGAAGGVIYRAIPSREKRIAALEELSRRLSRPGRLLPGDFLYTTDITCDSDASEIMGEILACRYYEKNPNFVLTMETKGINYISGETGDRIETMALARRAVTPGQRALIIDDFMKGGGTLRGMHDLMREFDVEVVGTGVVIATAEPHLKRVEGVTALMVLSEVDREKGSAVVKPSDWIYED